MKKLRIYLDTSVIGGCFDEEFEEYSLKVIYNIKNGKFKGVISDITIAELKKAPQEVKNVLLDIPGENIIRVKSNEEVAYLADEYLNQNILSSNFREDALHIAFATVFEVDLLLSWNFKHIVNYNRIHQFNAVNMKEGYKTLEIRSPMELYYEE